MKVDAKKLLEEYYQLTLELEQACQAEAWDTVNWLIQSRQKKIGILNNLLPEISEQNKPEVVQILRNCQKAEEEIEKTLKIKINNLKQQINKVVVGKKAFAGYERDQQIAIDAIFFDRKK